MYFIFLVMIKGLENKNEEDFLVVKIDDYWKRIENFNNRLVVFIYFLYLL